MKSLFRLGFARKPNFMYILQYVVLVAMFMVIVSTDSFAAHVQKIRLGDHPDKTRLVIELSQKLEANAFLLSSPDRLVVDFKGRNLSCASLSAVENKLLRFARKSEDEQTLRLVFDLKKSVSIKSKFFLPASGGRPNRFVVDLIEAPNKPQMQLAPQKQMVLKKAPKTYPSKSTKVVKENQSYTPKKATAKNKKYVIVVDPGHGGKDPGAIGANGVFEKTIVLATSKMLKQELEATGRYKVHLTRSDDRYIRLSERVRIARRLNADMFVSVHADSVESRKVQGASVYTLSEKASSAQAARLAARANKSDAIAGLDLSEEDADVTEILIDLAMRDTKNQSIFLAHKFVDSFRKHNIKTLGTPMHSAGFAVLKAPDIPSVLVELGFISNKTEARALSTSSYQRRMAKILRDSVDAYFKQQVHYDSP